MTPRRWRFSLRSLILCVAVLSLFLATTLSGGRVEEMGRSGIFGRHYGWPVAYLRVPTGEHAGKVASDVFVPGLFIDLGLAALFVAVVFYGWSVLRRARRRG